MPLAANPQLHEFYVYQYLWDDYPFYVGIGRAARGPDRVRYAKSLMRSKNSNKLKQSSLCVRVIARLVRKQEAKIRFRKVADQMTRSEALALEKKKIEGLVRNRYLLTNWQYNPHRHRNVEKAVDAIFRNIRIGRAIELSNRHGRL